mgnify:CR=1 FL=1
MPYIKKEHRKLFDSNIKILSDQISCDGDLNYIITSLVHKELLKRGVNYQNMNNLVGSMECAKNEFIRVVIGPYEDKKRVQNGNISELDK